MATYSTLQNYLEQYLKREGLLNIIPEYRREPLFPLPIATIWVAFIFLIEIYFTYSIKGINGLLAGLLIPLFLGAVLFLFLLVFFLLKQLLKKQNTAQVDATVTGGIILLGFPPLLAIITGLYLRSWSAGLWILGLSIFGIILIAVLNSQTFPLFLFFELIRSIFRTIAQSLALISLLLPILLAIVLLSIFTQDLWQALGNLTLFRIIEGVVLVALPAFLLVRVSANKLIQEIIGEFPELSDLKENAKRVEFLSNKLDQEFISKEEWSKANNELVWRHKEKLAEALTPLKSRVKLLFGLLLVITNFTLIAVFFFYFYVLFWVLIGEAVIAEWTNIQLSLIEIPINLFGKTWQFPISSATIPLIKVSLLLAVFVSVITTTQAMIDDSFKEIFTERLKHKYNDWLAISSIYLSITSPNYQIWEYIVSDKKLGRANVNIVVPQELTEKQIEEACEHMATRLEKYRHWIRVTAFEQKDDQRVYGYGIPGKRWVLHHNKVNGSKHFEENHLILEELHEDHNLGQELIRKNEEIPDEWFGESSEAVKLARIIWDADIDHSLILHPYISIPNDNVVIAHLHLTRRLTSSGEYEDFIRDQLVRITQYKPAANKIMISALSRETFDILASLDWNKDIDFVTYFDKVLNKSKTQHIKSWES